MFRVGLVLLKQVLGSVDKLRELQGMYETMERLRNISPDCIREEILVQEVGFSFSASQTMIHENVLLLLLRDMRFESLRLLVPGVVIPTSSVCFVLASCVVQIVTLPVTEALIERECSIQVRKWRESRGELTHQPGRRLHGTRDVYEHKRRAAAISSGGSFSFLGSSIPPPGPLRASSSLLSLPGFRKSKAPLYPQIKKGSFSGPSGMEVLRPQSPPAIKSSQGPSHKPPIPPGAGQRAATPQSPLVVSTPGSSRGSAQPSEGNLAQDQPAASAPTQSKPPPSTLSPSPKIVSEQITPTIPSPTANNAPLLPCPDSKKEAAPVADQVKTGEEEGKKKKKSKDDKRKEKEDEKRKLKEKKDKDKAEKERLKKEKERLEKEKKKAGKKKDRGGGEAEDKNGAAAARDSA